MSTDVQSLLEQLREKVSKHRAGVLLGGLIGLLTGGFIGIFIGAGVGYWLERVVRRAGIENLNPQQAFFRATFAVMGRVAKADGRVSENEIAYARQVMTQLNLDEARRREAIELFNQGKAADFDLDSVLRPLAMIFRYRLPVKLMFVEVQLQAALADGEMSPAEREIIERVCGALQLDFSQIEALIARMRAHYSYHEHAGAGQREPSRGAMLKEAYGVLGVTEAASDGEVKKAYRRLMNQHHPDKLVSKGLPEEMITLAKEKTQEIQAAYDLIKQARKAAA